MALLEARMSNELARLIRRAGGEPRCVPAVRESPLNCREAVTALIDSLTGGKLDGVIFLTGVGVKALGAEAERLSRLSELLDGLRQVMTVCRGPKPVAALKRLKIPISLTAPEPNTTNELLAVLAEVELTGKRFALLHYGERNIALTEALRGRSVQLMEVCLYEWLRPEDPTPLQQLVRDLVGGQLEAIAFTSQIQVRHLFQAAEEIEQATELKAALSYSRALEGRQLIVASIGPTCTGVLQEFGVLPAVVPEHPKMGHLVAALAEYVGR